MSNEYLGDDESVTLWQHARPFRRLVFVAVALLLVIAYGFRYAHVLQKQQAHIDAVARQLRATQAQNAATTNPNNVIASAGQLSFAPSGKMLNQFPLATNTMGERLNPNKRVPVSGFDAYYFNTQEPTHVVHQENVINIHLEADYDSFHKIPSQFLGGYWIGMIQVPADGDYVLSVNSSWSFARALIDGRVIGEDATHGSFGRTVYLNKGNYVLELEYKNNWHSADMYFSFQKDNPIYKKEILANTIAQLGIDGGTKLYAVAIQKSQNPDKIIDIYSDIKEPYVLLLSGGQRGMLWQIYGTPPKAIIYGYGDGQIRSVGSPYLVETDAIFGKNFLSEEVYCYCNQGHFGCSDYESIEETVATLRDITGLTLVGGKTEFALSTVYLPDVMITPTMIANQTQSYLSQKKSCEADLFSAQ